MSPSGSQVCPGARHRSAELAAPPGGRGRRRVGLRRPAAAAHCSAPNDPLYADGQPVSPGPAVGQWYLRAPGGAVHSSIDVEAAWALTTGRPRSSSPCSTPACASITPDLRAASCCRATTWSTTSPIADDGNGRDADASDPGDWVTAAEKATTPRASPAAASTDSSWHGTQTAEPDRRGDRQRHRHGRRRAATCACCRCACSANAAAMTPTSRPRMRWAAGLDVPGVPAQRRTRRRRQPEPGRRWRLQQPATSAVIDEVAGAGTTSSPRPATAPGARSTRRPTARA